MKPVYPIVECYAHPETHKPGYVVCIHVLQRVEIGHFERATAKRLGVIVCAPCYPHTLDENVTLVCEDCARENGLLLATA